MNDVPVIARLDAHSILSNLPHTQRTTTVQLEGAEIGPFPHRPVDHFQDESRRRSSPQLQGAERRRRRWRQKRLCFRRFPRPREKGQLQTRQRNVRRGCQSATGRLRAESARWRAGEGAYFASDSVYLDIHRHDFILKLKILSFPYRY